MIMCTNIVSDLNKNVGKSNGMPFYNEPIELNDKNFDEKIKEVDIALADFYGDWCHPCRVIEPMMYRLAKKYAGKIMIAKINVDKNLNLAFRYNIRSIPLVIVFLKGKYFEQYVGARSLYFYDDLIKKLIEKNENS